MNSVITLLLLKSTALLLLGIAVAATLRSAPACVRHLVLAAALGAAVIFPAGLLLPPEVTPDVLAISTAVSTGSFGPETSAPVREGLLAIWGLVSFVLLSRLALDARRAWLLVRSSTFTRRLGNYEVRVANVNGPMAWSFGSGVILLPPDSAGWTADQRDAVISHEAAHLKRRDSWWLCLAEIACALYWFHPLVWHAATRLRTEQEHAADDLVLQTGMDPASYATILISVVRRSRREMLLAGAGTASVLAERVKAILDAERRRTMINRKMLAAAMLLVLVVALPLPGLQTPRTIYKIGGDVTPPQVIYKEEPQYTPEARDAKIEGSVLMAVVVESSGRLTDIRVVRGLDDGLDKNAIAALQNWQFRPAQKEGKAVAVSANVEVNFRLL